MFGALHILILEDEALVAMDLADAVEAMDGIVIGPIATVANALEVLDSQAIAAAILDAKLLDRDVTPVALRLVSAGIPFVVHTGTGLPEELAAQFPDLPVLMKPTPALTVVQRLLVEMTSFGRF